ncbi:MAG TPA: trehalase-like domain-containing protein, partial [Gemmatimonadales bacterium]|nr:trehalase-like domain-containing protein [Gemmatimonadales bacterium]
MTETAPAAPALLHHAAFGNGRVLALVASTSAIEWLCLPRFDSPSVFGRLLDRDKGGTFRILHASGELSGKMGYLPNTNVVRTEFHADDGSWEVIDFAPRIPYGLGVKVPIEIVRMVRPLEGEPRLVVDFDPRPDYARVEPRMRETVQGLEVSGAAVPLLLSSSLPIPYITGRRQFVLTRPHYFIMSYGPREHSATMASAQHDQDRTIAGWRAWCRSCALPSFGTELVLRSALVLKLHAYHDTGAVIAAATTSI